MRYRNFFYDGISESQFGTNFQESYYMAEYFTTNNNKLNEKVCILSQYKIIVMKWILRLTLDKSKEIYINQVGRYQTSPSKQGIGYKFLTGSVKLLIVKHDRKWF